MGDVERDAGRTRITPESDVMDADAIRLDAERMKDLDAALPPMHYSTEIAKWCATTKPDGNGSLVMTASPLTCECKFFGATTTVSALTEMRNKLPILTGYVFSLLSENIKLNRLNLALADRVKAQGELLSQKAERIDLLLDQTALLRELTPEEAEAAYQAAEPVPLSEERINEIVEYATRQPPPDSAPPEAPKCPPNAYGFDMQGPDVGVYWGDRNGFPCACEWLHAYHGDRCPEHGKVGVPICVRAPAPTQVVTESPIPEPPLTGSSVVVGRPESEDDDEFGGKEPEPIDMILHCPKCGAQHIDAPEPERDWSNPPHKSHLCHKCGVIWRPADVATNGVVEIKTRGARDTVPG